jgi:hypothetical protein
LTFNEINALTICLKICSISETFKFLLLAEK